MCLEGKCHKLLEKAKAIRTLHIIVWREEFGLLLTLLTNFRRSSKRGRG
jgi:hypothetical protein